MRYIKSDFTKLIIKDTIMNKNLDNLIANSNLFFLILKKNYSKINKNSYFLLHALHFFAHV